MLIIKTVQQCLNTFKKKTDLQQKNVDQSINEGHLSIVMPRFPLRCTTVIGE